MRRVLLVLAVAVTALASSAPAAAQGISFAFGMPPGAKAVSETDILLGARGRLTVMFHGDAAAGCQARGVCGYSGAVTWQPGSGGDLVVLSYRLHGRTHDQAFMALGFLGGPATTTAHVVRAGGGTCADSTQTNTELPVTFAAGRFTITPIDPGGSLLATRCAGPLGADLSAPAPRVTLPAKQLLAGHRTVDLAGSGSFRSGGFSGTISSTLVLALGRARHPSMRNSFPPGIKLKRLRLVSESLTPIRSTGALSVGITTDPNPALCEPLDACGIDGELGIAPRVSGGSGQLIASGPATRPYRDFLKALGLSRSGNARGIAVSGAVNWRDTGTFDERITQGGVCADSAPIGISGLGLIASGGSLHASYQPSGTLRTGCPGPFVPPTAALATGTVPIKALGGRTLTIGLQGGRTFTDAAYRASVSGRVSLTLRRGALAQRTILAPTG